MTYHHKNEPIRVKTIVTWLVDAQDSQYVCCRLKACAERDDPTVRFSMDKHLYEMCYRGDAEHHCEEVGCWEVRTEMWPDTFGIAYR